MCKFYAAFSLRDIFMNPFWCFLARVIHCGVIFATIGFFTDFSRIVKPLLFSLGWAFLCLLSSLSTSFLPLLELYTSSPKVWKTGAVLSFVLFIFSLKWITIVVCDCEWRSPRNYIPSISTSNFLKFQLYNLLILVDFKGGRKVSGLQETEKRMGLQKTSCFSESLDIVKFIATKAKPLPSFIVWANHLSLSLETV